MRPMRLAVLAVGLVLSLALGACGEGSLTGPGAGASPPPFSPEAAVRAFSAAWTNRDTAAYLRLLTDDFLFGFGLADSNANPYRAIPWDLAMERAMAGHLMVGGGMLPPAVAIRVTCAAVLHATEDPRPGRDPRVHQVVRTNFTCLVTIRSLTGTATTRVEGVAAFWLVRGDSAALSPARVAAGQRDSTYWFIERWDDETVPDASTTTMGGLKRQYLPADVRPAP